MLALKRILGSVVSLLLWAGQAAAESGPGGDYEQYVPKADKETLAPLFVVISYSVIWLLLLAFALSLWLRQGRIDRQMKQLQHQLNREA
jgi:CcmD family protein